MSGPESSPGFQSLPCTPSRRRGRPRIPSRAHPLPFSRPSHNERGIETGGCVCVCLWAIRDYDDGPGRERRLRTPLPCLLNAPHPGPTPPPRTTRAIPTRPRAHRLGLVRLLLVLVLGPSSWRTNSCRGWVLARGCQFSFPRSQPARDQKPRPSATSPPGCGELGAAGG
jgi:hypothetical protein